MTGFGVFCLCVAVLFALAIVCLPRPVRHVFGPVLLATCWWWLAIGALITSVVTATPWYGRVLFGAIVVGETGWTMPWGVRMTRRRAQRIGWLPPDEPTR